MPEPLYLAIETSNPSAWTGASPARPGVAIGRPEGRGIRVLGTEAIETGKTNEDDLMPAIARLFERVALRPRDLSHVAVSIGPGGFTAVRLAVTTAKMIAEATGAQCLPVLTAEVVARRVRSGGRVFAVALASKGETAFVTCFSGDGCALGPGSLKSAADLAGLGVELLVSDQFLPLAMRTRAGELGIRVVAPEFDPGACLEAALSTKAVDPAELLPLYPREPEAVTKWRLLHPPG